LCTGERQSCERCAGHKHRTSIVQPKSILLRRPQPVAGESISREEEVIELVLDAAGKVLRSAKTTSKHPMLPGCIAARKMEKETLRYSTDYILDPLSQSGRHHRHAIIEVRSKFGSC
jgi:hypothetical protein